MAHAPPYARKEGALVVSYPAGALPVKTHSAIVNATKLYLSNASIQELRGLHEFECLQVLYLNSNELSSLQGLEKNLRLKALIASDNNIRDVETLACMPFLEELDLSRNAIAGLDAVVELLSGLRRLQKLNLGSNPVAQEAGYRKRIIAAVPSLAVFDDIVISGPERKEAEEGAKDAASPKKQQGKPKDLSSSSATGGNHSSSSDPYGSVLVAALEKEVAQIKEKRRARAQEELQATFKTHVDPEWVAAADASEKLSSLTLALGQSSKTGGGVESELLRQQLESITVKSALASVLASSSASGEGEELVRRGIKAALERRSVQVAADAPLLPLSSSTSSSLGSSIKDPSAPRNQSEALFLKAALVSSFLPPTVASSSQPSNSFSLSKTVPPSSTAPSSTFGPPAEYTMPLAKTAGSLSKGPVSSLSRHVVTMKTGTPLSATLLQQQGASASLLPPSSPLRSTGSALGNTALKASGSITVDPSLGRPVGPGLISPNAKIDMYRPRTKADPEHFAKTVTGNVDRLITLELSGGISSGSSSSSSSNNNNNGNASSGTAVVGWDRYKVNRAFVEFLQSKAAGVGSNGSISLSRPPSGSATKPPPAAAAAAANSGKPPSAGASGKPAGLATMSDVHAAAAALPTKMSAANIKAALLSCKDFGICPEPESSTPSSDSSGGGGGASSATLVKDSERLSEFVDTVVSAMTGGNLEEEVSWHTFLAAVQSGSCTRQNNAIANAATSRGSSAGENKPPAGTPDSKVDAASAGPSIVQVPKLRFRPISEAEASDRAAMHFKRASDAMAALQRLSASQEEGSSKGGNAAAASTSAKAQAEASSVAATIAGLKRVIQQSTERGNRLADIAAALGGTFDPPPPPPPPNRPRSDYYSFKTLLPAQQAHTLLRAAEIAGGSLGWSHHMPLPGEEEDEDEKQAIAALLTAKRKAAGLIAGGSSGGAGKGGSAAVLEAAAKEKALVAGLEAAIKSPQWAEHRAKARAAEPKKIVKTTLPI